MNLLQCSPVKQQFHRSLPGARIPAMRNSAGRAATVAPLGGSASVPATLEYAYQYDDIGNRITSTDITTNRTYTANNLNQYTLISNLCDSASLREEFVPQFDDDGNQTLIQTSTGVWSVQYNGENRPVLWTGGTSSAATNIVMSFDRMGRRMEYREIQTTGASGGNTPTTTVNTHHSLVYDDYLCIQRLEAANGNAVDLTFVWDVTEPVATRPLIIDKPGVCKACVTHDGSKNVSDLISSSDMTITAHYDYAPFGAIINSSFSLHSSHCNSLWRFSSECVEDDLGLVYYNYRCYDPNVGTWLSRDPYKEDENTFFVDNDPVGAFDWLGLETEHSSCVSISHSKNFDFRNKPLGRIGLAKFNGTLAFGYSLKGEACLTCCTKGGNAGLKKLSGSGEVLLSGQGSLSATVGVDFKSSMFWDFYRLYLFGGIQASVTLSGSGSGSFAFDGCKGTGALNASISDSLEFAFRGGVEGHLKRRGGRRNGNWHYNTVAAVAALAKVSVSSSLTTTLSCNTEKCILTSSIGGIDASVGLEFTFKRKTLSLDIWRFHGDGVVLAETEFESPLKGWTEQ